VYSGDSKHDISVGSVNLDVSAALVIQHRQGGVGGGSNGAGGGSNIRVVPVASSESSLAPISDATVAIDKALGQWNDRRVNGDYADLALATL